MTQLGEYDKGLIAADQVLKSELLHKIPLLGIDTIISKANALVMNGRLDESNEEIEKGEILIDEMQDVKQPELNIRRANLDYIKGLVYRKKGNLDHSLKHLRKSLSLSQELGNQHGIADSYNIIGIVHVIKGELDQALEYFHKSLTLYEGLDYKIPMSKLINNIGLIYWQKGDLDQALEYYHDSLAVLQKLGNNQLIASSLSNIGLIYWNRGDLNYALDYYRSSLLLLEELDSKLEIADVYSNIGLIYKDKGELDLSLDYYLTSLTIRQELENKHQIANSFNNIGEIYQIKGNLKVSRDYYKKSLDLYDVTGNNLNLIEPIYNLIKIAINDDILEEAQKYLQRLQIINDNEENKLFDLYYRLAKAMILKTSDRVIKKAEAQQLLQKITEEEVIKFDLTVDAIINLYELLLLELKTSGSEEVLSEVKSLLSQLLKLAKAQNSHWWLANTLLLQFKLAMLELDIETARQFLDRAQQIAEEKGLKKLEQMISQERILIITMLNKWEMVIEQKPSIGEIMELTQFDDLIERTVKKRLFRDEEEINQYAKDAKHIFEKWEKSQL
ncbi:MAG: tetratricopeptide repeat protein [Candidatus Hodarchaeales archaeon]|jgi:tetratricopeptide (TPR) repeat protein